MKSSDIVRAKMKDAGITQKELADKLGYKTQSCIGDALARKNGVRIDVFVKMMNALGYEVIVRRGKDEEVVTE